MISRQQDILRPLLIIDLWIGSLTLIPGIFLGASLWTLLLVLPLVGVFYLLRLAKDGETTISINLAVVALFLQVYLIDTGLYEFSGSFLLQIPVLIGVFLFHSIGVAGVRTTGLISLIVCQILVGTGLSPRLLFPEVAPTVGWNNLIMFSTVLSTVLSLAVLQVFATIGKQKDNDLELRQANLMALLENTRDAVWSVDKSLRLVSFNSNYKKLFRQVLGRDPEVGYKLFSESTGQQKLDWENWFGRVWKGETFSVDFDFEMPGVGLRTFEFTFNPVVREFEVIGAVAKAADVTSRKVALEEQKQMNESLGHLLQEHKEAQDILEQQRLFLDKLISHLPIGVYVKKVSENLSYSLWNQELEEMFGLPAADVIGKTDAEVFQNAGEIAHYLATDQMVLRDREPILIQKLSIRSGNEQLFARTFKIPLLDANGEVESILGILENITDLVHSQQELERSEKRWNYALSGSRDAVWDVDLITRESFFSTVFSEMLGYKAFETLKENWEDLVHPDDLAKAWNQFVDHLEGKTHFYECEYRMRKKDGSYFWVLDRGKVAETDNDGNPVRVIGTFSNIDDRKKLEQEYRLALEKAEEANKAKNLFLSTMSHEIRTPMNGVIGIIELLIRENPRADQKENLEALKYSADNLMLLLNDILDFSKIDAGKMDLAAVPFPLQQTVVNATRAHQNTAKSKDILLNCTIDPELPKTVTGDPLRLQQVLNNLISNAIKFTQEGQVDVFAEHLESEEGFVTVRFTVADSGIGIEGKFLPHLFDHFTQASSETTRRYGGTGLGLAICKRLVDVMGGKLEVSSKPDEGTRFWFTLKYEVSEKSPDVKDLLISDTSSLQCMQVLLVEDNPMNIFVTRKFLERWQVQIDDANNGKEALFAVQKKRYDLILMDLQMPEMDGFEAATQMRKGGLKTPIVALSANASSEARDKVIQSGMNEFMSKPFNPEALLQTLLKYYKPRKPSSGPGQLF